MPEHYGHESSATNCMVLDFWLTVGRSKNKGAFNLYPSVRVTAKYPNLSRNERAINLKMKLPLALFEAPSLTASIEVEAPQQVVNIEAGAIAEAVKSAIGMDVEITVNQSGDS